MGNVSMPKIRMVLMIYFLNQAIYAIIYNAQTIHTMEILSELWGYGL